MKFFILVLLVILVMGCGINLALQNITPKYLGEIRFTKGVYFLDQDHIFVKSSFILEGIEIDSEIRELNLYSQTFINGFYVYVFPQENVAYFKIARVDSGKINEDEVIPMIIDSFKIKEINNSLTKEEFENFWGRTNLIIIEDIWEEKL